jgi:hypothetical protein
MRLLRSKCLVLKDALLILMGVALPLRLFCASPDDVDVTDHLVKLLSVTVAILALILLSASPNPVDVVDHCVPPSRVAKLAVGTRFLVPEIYACPMPCIASGKVENFRPKSMQKF